MDNPIRWPAKLLLLDQCGEQVCWMARAHAREWWDAGKVRLHLRGRAVRAVQLSLADPGIYFPRPSPVGGRHYSHDHETQDNPEGCWTLIRIPRRDQGVFLRVLADCGGLRRTRRRPPECLAA